MSKKTIPLFYYRDANQYNEFLSVFTDAHALPATFDAWQRDTEISIQILEHQGVVVTRIYPESTDEFINCCRDFEWSIDEEGRRYFTFLKSRQ